MSKQDKKATLILILMTSVVVILLVSTKQLKGSIQAYVPDFSKMTHAKADKSSENSDAEFSKDNENVYNSNESNEIVEDKDIKESQIQRKKQITDDDKLDNDEMIVEDRDMREDQIVVPKYKRK